MLSDAVGVGQFPLVIIGLGLCLGTGCLEPVDLGGLVVGDSGALSGSVDGGQYEDVFVMDAQADHGDASPDGELLDGEDMGRGSVDDGGVVDMDSRVDAALDAQVDAGPPLPICGDGVLGVDEQCDDGNRVNGDGCKSDCNRDTCGAYPRRGRFLPEGGARGRFVAADERLDSFAILMDDHVQVEGGGGLVKWQDFTIDADIFGKVVDEGGDPVYSGASRMIMPGGVLITSAEAPLALQRGPRRDDCVHVYEFDARNFEHPNGRLEKPIVRFGQWAVAAYGGALFALPATGPADVAGDCNAAPGQAPISVSPLNDALGDIVEIPGGVLELAVATDRYENGLYDLVALSNNGSLHVLKTGTADDGTLLITSNTHFDGPCGAEGNLEALDMVPLRARQPQRNKTPIGDPSVAVLCRTFGDARSERASIWVGSLTGLCPDNAFVDCLVPDVTWTGGYSLGFAADHLSAGDVDGDGLADLAAVGRSDDECVGSLEVLLQSGVGERSFVRRPVSEDGASYIAIGTAPSAVLISDVRSSGDYDDDAAVIAPSRSEVIVVNAGAEGAMCDQRQIEIISHSFQDDKNQNGQGDRCEEPCPAGLGGPRCDEYIYTHVAAGSYHNCGVTPAEDGQSAGLRCWGNEFAEVLSLPVLRAGERFLSVAATRGRTCTIIEGMDANRTQCWPEGAWVGEFGGAYSAVSIGASFACGLNMAGSLDCVGTDDHHPTGTDQDEANRLGDFGQQLQMVESVSVADNHACWLNRAGALRCWGNRFGRSNDSVTRYQNIPAALTAMGQPRPMRSVVVGSYENDSFACGLTMNGEAACWGAGFGDFQAPQGAPFYAISADDGTACGITGDGRLHCWGNHGGLVGNAPPGLYKSVSVGSGHACALTQMGTVRCWGDGGHPNRDMAMCPNPPCAMEQPDGTDRNDSPAPSP